METIWLAGLETYISWQAWPGAFSCQRLYCLLTVQFPPKDGLQNRMVSPEMLIVRTPLLAEMPIVRILLLTEML